MNRIVCAFACFLLLVVSLGVVGADAGEAGRQVKIEWPGGGFRDLQSAINAAPDGARVEIKEGIYQINEPLFVRGKRLVIAGAGSGQKNKHRITHLVGPPPRPVVDDRGNLVLRAEAVEGLWNFVAADVLIQDMRLTGFDAGIVSKPDDGNSGPTEVKDVVITDTGRGILSLSSSDLSVEDCTIMNTQWNGISFGGNLDLLPSLKTKVVTIIDASGAGIYFEHAFAFIDDANVLSATTGGIVGFQSSSFITDSNLVGNMKGGILLQAGYSEIENNVILATKAGQSGELGDGISLWASIPAQQSIVAFVLDNLIQSTDRAGISVFGASASMEDNDIFCQSVDLFGAEYGGFDFSLDDLGGNQCGCGSLTICAAKGEGLEPPPPVGGLE